MTGEGQRKGDAPFTPPLQRGALRFALWALRLPITSLKGAVKIRRLSKDNFDSIDSKHFKSKNILIVGSGPSLDLVDQEFFAQYDSIICINYAIARFEKRKETLFFTTDIGVLINLINDMGRGVFDTLGRRRSIIAPIFFEQIDDLPESHLREFTWLRPSSLTFKFEKAKRFKFLGISRIPYSARFYPAQTSSVLKLPCYEGEREQISQIPILEHTSALSAIWFAASCGAQRIDLIGCDFSEGRAKGIMSTQPLPTENTFSGARSSFIQTREALATKGHVIRNLSWGHPFHEEHEGMRRAEQSNI